MPVSPAPAEAAPAKVSLRQKHADATRQRILDEAMTLFLAQGFEATTVEEIADRADVSPRTFFRYFATKEALLFHDFEERLEQIQDLIAGRPPDEGPAEALVEALCVLVEELRATPERKALMVRLVQERPAIQAYQRTTIVEHTERKVTALLAGRAGLDPGDLGIRAMVAAVSACLDVALREWLVLDADGPFDVVFRQTLAACAAAFPTAPAPDVVAG